MSVGWVEGRHRRPGAVSWPRVNLKVRQVRNHSIALVHPNLRDPLGLKGSELHGVNVDVLRNLFKIKWTFCTSRQTCLKFK